MLLGGNYGYMVSVLVSTAPGIILITLGLVLSLLRLRSGRWARLAAVGFGVLLAQDVAWLAVQAAYAVGDGPIGGYRLIQLWGWVGTALTLAGTALLVAAVFTGRGPLRNDPVAGGPTAGPVPGYGSQGGYGPPQAGPAA